MAIAFRYLLDRFDAAEIIRILREKKIISSASLMRVLRLAVVGGTFISSAIQAGWRALNMVTFGIPTLIDWLIYQAPLFSFLWNGFVSERFVGWRGVKTAFTQLVLRKWLLIVISGKEVPIIKDWVRTDQLWEGELFGGNLKLDLVPELRPNQFGDVFDTVERGTQTESAQSVDRGTQVSYTNVTLDRDVYVVRSDDGFNDVNRQYRDGNCVTAFTWDIRGRYFSGRDDGLITFAQSRSRSFTLRLMHPRGYHSGNWPNHFAVEVEFHGLFKVLGIGFDQTLDISEEPAVLSDGPYTTTVTVDGLGDLNTGERARRQFIDREG
jgi:hypothetical protein